MEFVALIVLFTLALSNNVALKVADFLGESFDIRDMSCFLKLLNPFLNSRCSQPSSRFLPFSYIVPCIHEL